MSYRKYRYSTSTGTELQRWHATWQPNKVQSVSAERGGRRRSLEAKGSCEAPFRALASRAPQRGGGRQATSPRPPQVCSTHGAFGLAIHEKCAWLHCGDDLRSPASTGADIAVPARGVGAIPRASRIASVRHILRQCRWPRNCRWPRALRNPEHRAWRSVRRGGVSTDRRLMVGGTSQLQFGNGELQNN